MRLEDRVYDLMQRYEGSPRYYNTMRGFSLVAAKLEDEGFDSKQVDDAVDEYGNKYWLKRRTAQHESGHSVDED